MDRSPGEEITNIILENGLSTLLELGVKHGVSTCYMAGALDELGEGTITTIDLEHSEKIEPNIESLLGSRAEGLAFLKAVRGISAQLILSNATAAKAAESLTL